MLQRMRGKPALLKRDKATTNTSVAHAQAAFDDTSSGSPHIMSCISLDCTSSTNSGPTSRTSHRDHIAANNLVRMRLRLILMSPIRNNYFKNRINWNT